MMSTRTRCLAIGRDSFSSERTHALLAALGYDGVEPRIMCRDPAVLEWTVDGPRAAAQPGSIDGWDLALLPPRPADWSRVLVAVDMDSTLIQQEVIDELGRQYGVFDDIREITERAMRGELDFRESLAARTSQLAGLPITDLLEVRRRTRLSPGADRLFSTLKRLGARSAILSGGFHFVGQPLRYQLGIDDCFAHELEASSGRLTGRIAGAVIDAAGKAECLGMLARRYDADFVVAVGDGANDLKMLERADLGIAFHAKPIVAAAADATITTLGLDAVLYFLGIADGL